MKKINFLILLLLSTLLLTVVSTNCDTSCGAGTTVEANQCVDTTSATCKTCPTSSYLLLAAANS